MKKSLIFFGTLLYFSFQTSLAQLVANNHFYIKSGTIVSMNGLVMTPSANLNLIGNTLQVSSQPAAGAPVQTIKRVYTFTNPVAFSGSMGVQYLPAELNGINENNLQVGYSSTLNANIGADAASVRDLPNHFVSVNLAGKNVRVVSLVNGQGALPVKLADFRAAAKENSIALDWTTTSEINADHFEIERAADGKTWSQIGSVAANGSGHSLEKYQYPDSRPLSGANFYRLKMVDQDGTFAFSQIRQVRWEGSDVFHVFPNPFVSELSIHPAIVPDIRSVSLVDAQGKEVVVTRDVDRNGVMHLSRFSAGIYVVKLTLQDGSVRTFKVVKN
ncbi:T9SS type A sorting domain-containing protein [Dyadobacter sandarakinus]|uniref:T9SS type A sorting domain-containing protein n=1 Tax=Dyadobacter sandarakinus TaxID=2747268 RepID=A0ABX7I8J4_9BACT|nr:T9SS type A sorting domain-containing protein [Dyadobacter sandarakinus]QRR02153.1 T9SS type A sorting domain-containing protein [Dyadobacter sandarakinus]